MNRQAFAVFRSAQKSLATRHVATTPSFNAACRRAVGARLYSAQASEKADAAEEQEEKHEAEISPESELIHKLKKKEEEVTDLTSRLRYLQADFLNLQRNAAREKEQQRDFAITKFAGDLLETVDVLAMALKSVPQSVVENVSSPSGSSSASPADKPPEQHLKELYTGVEMTHRILLQTLFKYHVKPFDPTGEKFDPKFHEALYQAPVPGKEPGTVLDCQKTGYMIKDRVLRAAQVGVVQDTS